MINEVTVRMAVKEDLPFIYSTWLKSYRYGSQFAKKLTNKVYYEWHHKLIERLFARGANCFVVVDSSDISVLYGYVVIEGPVMHFSYIKKPFRNLGLFNKLIETSGIKSGPFTHYTEFCDEYLKKHEGWEYNPYLV